MADHRLDGRVLDRHVGRVAEGGGDREAGHRAAVSRTTEKASRRIIHQRSVSRAESSPVNLPGDGDDLVAVLVARSLDRMLQHPRRRVGVANQRVLHQVEQVGGALPVQADGQGVHNGTGGTGPQAAYPQRVTQLQRLEQDRRCHPGQLEPCGGRRGERQTPQGPPGRLDVLPVHDRGQQRHGHPSQHRYRLNGGRAPEAGGRRGSPRTVPRPRRPVPRIRARGRGGERAPRR